EVGSPCRYTSPAVGRSSSPIRFSSVLFPEPEGPVSATNSAASSVRSIPCRTCVSTRSPYALRMPSSRRSGSAIADGVGRVHARGAAGGEDGGDDPHPHGGEQRPSEE